MAPAGDQDLEQVPGLAGLPLGDQDRDAGSLDAEPAQHPDGQGGAGGAEEVGLEGGGLGGQGPGAEAPEPLLGLGGEAGGVGATEAGQGQLDPRLGQRVADAGPQCGRLVEQPAGGTGVGGHPGLELQGIGQPRAGHAGLAPTRWPRRPGPSRWPTSPGLQRRLGRGHQSLAAG